MGMSNSENIAEVPKVRDEVAQNEDLQNGQTASGLDSNQFSQTQTVRVLESKKIIQESGGFESTWPDPAGVCWKSENNENWFVISRDDDYVIDWNTWCDNVKQTFVGRYY